MKHALVAMGKLATEKQISSVARPHWWSGTDEVGLARAARAFDCDLALIRRRDPDAARRALTRYLKRKIPVLLCVDGWEHWVTVVRYEALRFVVIDSRNDPVLKVVSWRDLRTRWKYVDDDGADIYDLHPVKPRFGIKVNAQFSVKRAQFLRRPENLSLARHWDEFMRDLLEICRPPSPRGRAALSMGEFLRRHQETLISRVVYWHGDVQREAVERLLRQLRFVAETYGLVIPSAQTRRALADVAILLALWTAATRGVNVMYGSDGNYKPRRH